MTTEATHQTDAAEIDEGVAAIEAMAAEAEAAEQADQEKAQAQAPDPGEWEDGAAQEAQARALAALGVKGVGMLAGIVHPGHSLDRNTRDEGEEALLPVARDFSGEVPEWLRPYMHYFSAGLWAAGVIFGAYRARKEEEAQEREQEQAKARQEAEGVPSGA